MIEINVKHSFGGLTLEINESIPSSGITAIFGRSGSGKTSLVNIISGLVTPSLGRVVVKDRVLFDKEKKINIAIEKRNIGYVFQDARLFPHYNVEGNLLYGVKGERNVETFDHIVSLLHLSHLLGRYPVDLSGGEKQRVAIARALLASPDMLLMDEPLASLDVPRKKEVMPFLEKLAQEINIPILYVTHSLSEILRLAAHLVLIDDGKVIANGKLESIWGTEVMYPWQPFSEQSSLFDAIISTQHEKYALTEVLLHDSVGLWVQHVNGNIGTSIRLQIRASDVSVSLQRPESSSIRNILPAKIVGIISRDSQNHHQGVELILDLNPGNRLSQTDRTWKVGNVSLTNGYLRASITQWAFDELGLKQDQNIFAQIKGIGIAREDITTRSVVGC